jgi:hypothetical protein
MGLKSGSRDAFSDEEETDNTTQEATESTEEETPSSGDQSEGGSDRPSMEAIPYIHRRDKVNEGREQVPFFLREAVIDGESELQDSLEEILGEDVYKSDYREAAMVVAQQNPKLVAEVLREWGYDLDAV